MRRQKTWRRFLGLVGASALASLLTVAGSIRADEPKKPDKKSPALVGVWQSIGYEYKGEPLTPVTTLFWNIQDDGTIELLVPTRKSDRPATWKYSIDPSKPNEIDLSTTEGPIAGKVFKAIYKIERNVLSVCYPKGNVPNIEGLRRPTSFDLSRQPDLQIIRLRRVSNTAGLIAVNPDPKDGPAVAFTALSDDFTVNGLSAAGKRDGADLARAIKSSDPALAALAKDARALMGKRLQLRLATEAWRHSAMNPQGISEEFVKKIMAEFTRPGAPALEDRNLPDDLITLLQTSGPNKTRVAYTVELLRHLEKVQTKSLPPVLQSRFPKASPDGGSVSMSVKIEKKLPAEMTLTNTGSKPLHNLVVWFHIEMGPLPDFSEQERKDLQWAYENGFARSAITKVENTALQNWDLAMGSRNIVFIPALKPKESAKIPYELGTIRYSKRAVFSLYGDELKVTDQSISGVREMQLAIEKSFGGRK